MAAVAAKPAMSSGMQMLYYVMADCRKESPWPRVAIPARKLLDIMVRPLPPHMRVYATAQSSNFWGPVPWIGLAYNPRRGSPPLPSYAQCAQQLISCPSPRASRDCTHIPRPPLFSLSAPGKKYNQLRERREGREKKRYIWRRRKRTSTRETDGFPLMQVAAGLGIRMTRRYCEILGVTSDEEDAQVKTTCPVLDRQAPLHGATLDGTYPNEMNDIEVSVLAAGRLLALNRLP
jgi:hypothetical protein